MKIFGTQEKTRVHATKLFTTHDGLLYLPKSYPELCVYNKNENLIFQHLLGLISSDDEVDKVRKTISKISLAPMDPIGQNRNSVKVLKTVEDVMPCLILKQCQASLWLVPGTRILITVLMAG